MAAYEEQVIKAASHKVYRHYTSIKSLVSILENKKLRLSVLGKVNDPIEERRIIPILKHKLFIASFCFDENQYLCGECMEKMKMAFVSSLTPWHLHPIKIYIVFVRAKMMKIGRFVHLRTSMLSMRTL